MSEGHFELPPEESESEEEREEKEAKREPSPERRLIEAVAESRANELHPERNEDAYFVDEEHGAAGVFDGVGGEAGGAHAAELARDYVWERLKDIPSSAKARDAEKAVREILGEANAAVLQEQLLRKSSGHPDEKEMGTTATIVKFLEGERGKRKTVVGHVGDTRVYRFRQGALEQLTLDDHTAIAELHVSEGVARKVQERLSNVADRREFEASKVLRTAFEHRNFISNILGRKNCAPRTWTTDAVRGDVFLLSSDGVHDNLTDGEIQKILGQTPAAEAAKALVLFAQARSRDEGHLRAKPDDMTAVHIAVPEYGRAG